MTTGDPTVLGQKYAYATAALLTGIACFVQLLGIERAILAIAFAILALRRSPPPVLARRRGFAVAGLVLGILAVIAVPVFLLLFRDRFPALLEALR
ncbi:MAG: hypothetical protein MUE73_03995 [Planctomycetes bacterium]|jgi:hypothetical protein|nr:hypothetical protein [Planctomycetota bacterium]